MSGPGTSPGTKQMSEPGRNGRGSGGSYGGVGGPPGLSRPLRPPAPADADARRSFAKWARPVRAAPTRHDRRLPWEAFPAEAEAACLEPARDAFEIASKSRLVTWRESNPRQSDYESEALSN